MEKGGAYNWGGACEGQGLAVAWASEGWGLWQRVGLLQGGVAYAEGAWFVMENSCWGRVVWAWLMHRGRDLPARWAGLTGQQPPSRGWGEAGGGGGGRMGVPLRGWACPERDGRVLKPHPSPPQNPRRQRAPPTFTLGLCSTGRPSTGACPPWPTRWPTAPTPGGSTPPRTTAPPCCKPSPR